MDDLYGMKVTLDKNSLLQTLRKNRENHAKIVQEATEGYLQKAEEKLKEKLEQIRQGKVTSLRFTLQPPADHTDEYDTAIRMLELHLGEDITLDAVQIRQLVMDNWSWKGQFLAVNAEYSSTAQAEHG